MDELQYRAAAPIAVEQAKPSPNDEQNYDTLKSVLSMMETELIALSKDFNAFTIAQGSGTDDAAKELVRQVEGRKLAYDILSPLYETIRSKIGQIDSKYRK